MEPPPLLYQKSVWPVDRFRHYGGLQRTQTSVAVEKPLPEQCGAARSPLDWTRERLAASAGVEETGRTLRTRPAGARNNRKRGGLGESVYEQVELGGRL